jgi:hypothetical protein
VAEREMVDILLRHFKDAGIKGVELIHMSPLP